MSWWWWPGAPRGAGRGSSCEQGSKLSLTCRVGWHERGPGTREQACLSRELAGTCPAPVLPAAPRSGWHLPCPCAACCASLWLAPALPLCCQLRLAAHPTATRVPLPTPAAALRTEGRAAARASAICCGTRGGDPAVLAAQPRGRAGAGCAVRRRRHGRGGGRFAAAWPPAAAQRGQVCGGDGGLLGGGASRRRCRCWRISGGAACLMPRSPQARRRRGGGAGALLAGGPLLAGGAAVLRRGGGGGSPLPLGDWDNLAVPAAVALTARAIWGF